MDERVLRAGEDHRDPGLVLGGVHGAVSHGDAGDVGELIPGAGGEFPDSKAVISGAELVHHHSPLRIQKIQAEAVEVV